MALRQDLDTWVRNRPRINHQDNDGRVDLLPMPPGLAPIPSEHLAIRETILASRGLRTQTRQLRAEMSSALHSLVSSLERIRMNQDAMGHQNNLMDETTATALPA